MRALRLISLVTFSFMLCLSIVDAQSNGAWIYTGVLNQARFNAQGVTLSDGRVLILGGQYQLRHPQLILLSETYDPATGVWSVSGNTNAVRLNSTATLLKNGQVLSVGGCADASCNTAANTAESYDPTTGSWTYTGNMVAGRSYHTATLLKNGKVLVTGGCYSVCGVYNLNTAELYDPAIKKWSATGSMAAARAQHTATLLPNGKVLVAGGISGANIVASAEIYDPATAKWASVGNMPNARRFAQATLLSNGSVLVMGGQNYTKTLAAADLYDPRSNRWSVTGSMSTPRLYFSAVSLLNGNVVAIGGANPSEILSSADIYDPTSKSWSATGSMNLGRIYFTANTLLDGRVLATAGNVGDNTSELYEP